MYFNFYNFGLLLRITNIVIQGVYYVDDDYDVYYNCHSTV